MNTMQYQITYFSPAGHAKKLAVAFQSILPPETPNLSLDKNTSPDADVHLVGFDFKQTDPKTIPNEVSVFLKRLEHKTIFLFATVPFQLNDVVERGVSNIVTPALPHECDYRGLYLCSAQPPDALLQNLEEAMNQNPNNARAKYWHERCLSAIGHPDKDDIKKGCQFANHVLP